MPRYKRVILVGQAGAGKAFLRDSLNTELVVDVRVTTRAPRAGEMRGYTYEYVSDAEFDRCALHDTVSFEGHRYGTRQSSWEASQVFVMSPSGVDAIAAADRNECLVLYLDISAAVRRARGGREDADFVHFEGDLSIHNPSFDRSAWTTVLRDLVV
jgi:ribose 1,5-bisphosphokinase PhnN